MEERLPDDVQTHKIFVGNISYRVGWKALTKFFGKFGKVKDCYVAKNHINQLPKGYAFITFASSEAVSKALTASDDQLTIDGRVVRLHKAEESKRTKGNVFNKIPTFESTESEDWDSMNNDLKNHETVDNEEFSVSICMEGICDDIIIIIMSYLPVHDRIRAERVCHRWRNLALESWKRQETLQFLHVFKQRFGVVTDKILHSLLLRCPNLKHLDLSASPRCVTDLGVDLIGKYCRQLRTLNLSGVDATNTNIKTISTVCSLLKVVILKKCIFIGEKGLWWLFKNCPLLEVVDLEGNVRLTGQCFHMLGGNVRKVILNDCIKLSDAGINHLTEKCPDIRELQISNCSKLTNASIYKITEVVQDVQVFRFGGQIDVSDTGLGSIAKLNLLVDLNMSQNMNVTDEVLNQIAKGCPQLEKLDISLCNRHVTDLGVGALARLDRLCYLNISYLHQVSAHSLRTVAMNGCLKVLLARACTQIDDECVRVIAEQCFELETIDLCGILDITTVTLRTFTNLFPDQSLTLHLGATSVIIEDVDVPANINVNMLNLSQNRLRPDREIILPSEDDDDESDGEDIHLEAEHDDGVSGIDAEDQGTVEQAKPTPVEQYVYIAEECDDVYDEFEDEFDDDYLVNDDPLASERWEMS